MMDPIDDSNAQKAIKPTLGMKLGEFATGVAGAISPNQYRSAYNMRKKPDDTPDKTPKKAPAPAPTSGAQAISQALGRK